MDVCVAAQGVELELGDRQPLALLPLCCSFLLAPGLHDHCNQRPILKELAAPPVVIMGQRHGVNAPVIEAQPSVKVSPINNSMVPGHREDFGIAVKQYAGLSIIFRCGQSHQLQHAESCMLDRIEYIISVL